MGHMGHGHNNLRFGLESLLSWRLHEWVQRAFCMAPDVHSRERLVYRDHLAPVPDLAGAAVDQNEVIISVFAGMVLGSGRGYAASPVCASGTLSGRPFPAPAQSSYTVPP